MVASQTPGYSRQVDYHDYLPPEEYQGSPAHQGFIMPIPAGYSATQQIPYDPSYISPDRLNSIAPPDTAARGETAIPTNNETTSPPTTTSDTGAISPPTTGTGGQAAPVTPVTPTPTDTAAAQLGALLGLSYGDQTYQNLPALQYALGNLAGGDYGNVSNEPIEVPGLGLTLPGASSMMNYDMLQNLIQNGSFDLLNSLYTAGNVPLSLILKIAQARAPLGNAYDAGMIETV